MNIALLNVVGEEGSTGKIVTKLAYHFISKGHNCKIYHGRGARINDALHVKHGCIIDTVIHYFLSRITGKEGYYSTFFTKRILKDISAFSPDWIITLNLHGHWLNIPLLLTEIANMHSYISIHMPDDFSYTARCEYSYDCEKYKNQCIGCNRYRNISYQYRKKRTCYEKLFSKAVFTSSAYNVSKARKSTLLSGARINTINPGIDVDFYHPVETTRLKEEYKNLSNKIILLNVASYSNKRKGVDLFLKAAEKMKTNDNYVFINVGFDGDKKLLPDNYIAIPYVSNQEVLREFYSMADYYVCTSIQDALPNACAEAMSCGTPVIAFNTSGMPYIASYPVLQLVSEISSDKLVETIITLRKKDDSLVIESRRQAVEKYSFQKNADIILEEFYEILSK